MMGVILVMSLSIGLSTLAGSPSMPEAKPTSQTAASQVSISTIYLPIVMNKYPAVVLLDAWTSGVQYARQLAYLPGVALSYHASGINQLVTPAQVNLRWTQTGPCGASTISNETFTVAPGPWEHVTASLAPSCIGVFTSTVHIAYKTLTRTLTTSFAVNTPSAVLLDSGQGFDRCYFPDVDQMQTWWSKSPYQVFNLYLGGASFGCKDQPLDAVWVHQVARQGWTFLLAWVGPQAPCTTFKNKMSANPDQAYLQGRAEADAAADAATRLGFFGNMVIYNDIEAYASASSSCRQAVQSYVRGWVERLHAHGLKAGGYGGACSSYVSDWASNNPAPDDVWLAHWYRSNYDPGATVWDTPCVSNSLWGSHQRVKQYAGGHNETWGGVTLNIDSNILDGQITSLLGAPASSIPNFATIPLTVQGPPLRMARMIDQNRGWSLVADRLLWTEDGGAGWRDISPVFPEAYRILGASFRATLDGWVVLQPLSTSQSTALQVLRTQDGVNWQANPILSVKPEEANTIETATLDLGEAGAAMLALKLQSGSSFSVGRLFATQDDGRTWQERSLPLGEPVKFLDALHGWTAGGPAGNLLYRTEDGGDTWEPQVLPFPPGGHAQVGLPHFTGDGMGWLPVIITGRTGNSLALYTSQDAGRSWNLDDSQLLGRSAAGGGLSPAAITSTAEFPAYALRAFLGAEAMPDGVIAMDFLDEQHGWALTQESSCQGIKRPAVEIAPSYPQSFRCEQHTRLLATADGGSTWREISP
jgi:hypothetical protein